MDTTYRKVTTLESSYLNHGTFGLAALDTDLGTIITDVATVDTNVDALLVDTGDGGDAETSAGATGSLHSKLRGLLVDAGDGTDAETSAGNAGSLHSKLRGILVDLGDGTDAVTAAGDAGSLHSKTRAILTDLAVVDSNVDALLVDTGDGTDAETAAGAVGSLHSKLHALILDTGDGTDAVTAAGNAGSLHSKTRAILVDLAVVDTNVDTLITNQAKFPQNGFFTVYPWPSVASVIGADGDINYDSTGTTQSTTYVEVLGYTVTSTETGTKTVDSVFIDFQCQHQMDTGTGNAKFAATSGTSYVLADATDVTDEFSATTTLTTENRSGSIKNADMGTLPFRLSYIGKVTTGTDTLTLKIGSNSKIEVFYKLS